MADIRERPDAPADVASYWDRRSAYIAASFDWRDVWAGEHAQAFTVAKAMRLDVATELRDAVGKAIKEGIPFSQFAKELEPKLQSMGWWGRANMVDPRTGKVIDAQLGSPRRLRTIYQANMRSARAAGFWARAQRTKRALPYLVYELGPSENHRPLHVAQQGKVYPVDHEYWGYWLSPNGWGCKCWQRQISRAEAESLGGVSAEPDFAFRDYTNKRTGETVAIPDGIDPGWHTNPGIAHAAFAGSGGKLKGSVAASLLASDDGLQNVMAGIDWTALPAFTNVVARSSGLDRNAIAKSDLATVAAPIALLPERVAEAMAVREAHTVMVNIWTMVKQLARHGDLRDADYAAIEAALVSGRLFRDPLNENHLVVIAPSGKGFHHIVLQRNAARYEVRLVHLMRVDARRAAQREAKLIAVEE
ncbi:MAG: phage minor head protein [Pseudomonadota bacterium]